MNKIRQDRYNKTHDAVEEYYLYHEKTTWKEAAKVLGVKDTTVLKHYNELVAEGRL